MSAHCRNPARLSREQQFTAALSEVLLGMVSGCQSAVQAATPVPPVQWKAAAQAAAPGGHRSGKGDQVIKRRILLPAAALQ